MAKQISKINCTDSKTNCQGWSGYAFNGILEARKLYGWRNRFGEDMAQRISSDRMLLPTTEACKISGFSSAYIQRLLRQKRIEGIKLGPMWLVYEDSLMKFVTQPRKRGPKGPHKKSKQNHTPTLSHPEPTKENS